MPGQQLFGQGGHIIARWVRHSTWGASVQNAISRAKHADTLYTAMTRALGLSTEHCGQDTVQSSCPLLQIKEQPRYMCRTLSFQRLAALDAKTKANYRADTGRSRVVEILGFVR